MEFLSEDPTYLLSGLGVVAVASLIALWVTQQGKFLIAAGVALALALVVFVVERAWVTQAERIAMVVEDLRRAVEASDVEGVTRHLTPDVQFVQGDRTVGSTLTLAFIRSTLENAGLDFVRVSGLTTAAFPESRRGTAEFRVTGQGEPEDAGGVGDHRLGRLGMVARLPGDQPGCLEGQPDHPDPRPRGDDRRLEGRVGRTRSRGADRRGAIRPAPGAPHFRSGYSRITSLCSSSS